MDPDLVRDPGWVSQRPSGEGQLVVHRVTAATVSRVATSRTPAWIVDPRLFSRAEERYFDLRNTTTWPTYEPVREALARLRARAQGREHRVRPRHRSVGVARRPPIDHGRHSHHMQLRRA